MNKKLGIGIIGLLVIITSYFGIQSFQKNKKIQSELINAVEEINRMAPIEVNKFCRLDSASAIGSEIFTYHYTLLDLEKSEVDSLLFSQEISPSLTKYIEDNVGLDYFVKNNITMDNKLYDKNGEYVTIIKVK